MTDQQQAPQYLAAVDLGSNSFHMVVARIEDGHIHIQDKLKEMVRLGAGLDEQNRLSKEARQQALICLHRFGERVRNFPPGTVAAVGTKTLRQAKKSRGFIARASKALGHPISVIGGKEEARLVYLGVSHSLVAEEGKRFVMDIGGGSTELIIGENFEPLHLRSLNMGCVSMSRQFFPNGDLTQEAWDQAGTAPHLKLRPVRKYFQKADWTSAAGASGTIKAVGSIVQALDLSPYHITLDSLYQVRKKMIATGHLDALDLPSLKAERKPVIAGGLAVLIATFEALRIRSMQVSDGALREGLLYERLGRIRCEDTRLKTVASVQQRFRISINHAERVTRTARQLFIACEEVWGLQPEDAELLHWAASLHEIGLAVSLSGYQKHGAYLLDHADLPGFSFEEQAWMSILVRCHRKKISKSFLKKVPAAKRGTFLRLAVLLRLATLFHRSRKDETMVLEQILVAEKELSLCFAEGELVRHPLQLASLKQEAGYLQQVGVTLKFFS
jgi:exopolyphosphatase/guanosine-5'-triphosphate,3'-diphosphate pyrophosphatase